MMPPAMRDPVEQRLAAVLAEMATISDALQRLEHDVAHLVNELGVTWDVIGDAHDPPISRQAARKRYDRPKPRRNQ